MADSLGAGVGNGRQVRQHTSGLLPAHSIATLPPPAASNHSSSLISPPAAWCPHLHSQQNNFAGLRVAEADGVAPRRVLYALRCWLGAAKQARAQLAAQSAAAGGAVGILPAAAAEREHLERLWPVPTAAAAAAVHEGEEGGRQVVCTALCLHAANAACPCSSAAAAVRLSCNWGQGCYIVVPARLQGGRGVFNDDGGRRSHDRR